MKGLIELKELHLYAKLADLQEVDYHNTLVLHAVIEILIDKGLLTRDELTQKVQELDAQLTFQTEGMARLTDSLLSRMEKTRTLS